MARVRTSVRSIAGFATATLLLTGCGLGEVLAGGDDDTEPTAETTEEAAPPTEPTEEPGEDAPDEDPAAAPDEDAGDTEPVDTDDESATEGGAEPAETDGDDAGTDDDGSSSPFDVRTGSVGVDQTESFDSGVQVAVTQVTVEPMAVFVDVEVLNGYTEEVSFASADPRLEDNTGRLYPYVPPEQNVDLLVPAGGSLSATIAFQGALNPSARTLTLELNPHSSFDQRPGTTFRDLPLPQAG